MKSKMVKLLINLNPFFVLFTGLSIGRFVRILRGNDVGNLYVWSFISIIGIIYTTLYLRYIIKNG